MRIGDKQNCEPPINKNVKENNININNININNTSIKRERKFTPPTINEINDYIAEKKLHVNGQTFYEYFDTGGWIDSRGNKVRNWKQKLLTWDSHRVPKDSIQKKQATFSDFLEKEIENDQERNNPDFNDYSNVVSEILPEYEIE